MSGKQENKDYLTFVPKKRDPKLTPPPFKPIHLVLVCIRFIASWTYLLTTIWLVWATLPTMILHPLLYKLGVPVFWFPVDIATRWFAKGLLLLGGIRGITEGKAKEPTVLVCNHLSALDSFAVYGYSPITMRFIMKRSIMWFCPPVFVLARLVGCITINRKAREEAIIALKEAAQKIKRSGRSFIVFPEGTRSRTGNLQPFKKGAFHMAKDANVTVTPAVLSGMWDLWPPGTLFPSPGTIKVSMLEPIETEGRSVEELLLEARTRIAKKIDEDDYQVYDNGHWIATAPAVVWLVGLVGVIRYFFF